MFSLKFLSFMDFSYCVTSISFNVFKSSISSFYCSEITIGSGILHIDKDLAMLSSLFYTLTISTVVIIELLSASFLEWLS